MWCTVQCAHMWFGWPTMASYQYPLPQTSHTCPGQVLWLIWTESEDFQGTRSMRVSTSWWHSIHVQPVPLLGRWWHMCRYTCWEDPPSGFRWGQMLQCLEWRCPRSHWTLELWNVGSVKWWPSNYITNNKSGWYLVLINARQSWFIWTYTAISLWK